VLEKVWFSPVVTGAGAGSAFAFTPCSGQRTQVHEHTAPPDFFQSGL